MCFEESASARGILWSSPPHAGGRGVCCFSALAEGEYRIRLSSCASQARCRIQYTPGRDFQRTSPRGDEVGRTGNADTPLTRCRRKEAGGGITEGTAWGAITVEPVNDTLVDVYT